MNCDQVRRGIDRPGGIEAGSRREFEEADRHLDACAGCAAYRRDRDPLRAFRALAAAEPPERFWDGFWDGVRGGLQEAGRLGPAETLALLRPGYRAAIAAAMVLAVGLLAFSALRVRGPVPGPEITMGPLPEIASGPAPDATVESIGSTQARITEVKVFGDGGDVTEVVLIFDEGIDL